jgi:hypothetical protein
MAEEATTRVSGPAPIESFRAALRDGEALHTFAREAIQSFSTHPPQKFPRLSELLDTLLPSDEKASASIARAVGMEARDLVALRRGTIDPLCAPRVALAALWQALRLEASVFRALVSADHKEFAGQLVGGLATRGGRETDAEAWASLESAYQSISLDAPDSMGFEVVVGRLATDDLAYVWRPDATGAPSGVRYPLKRALVTDQHGNHAEIVEGTRLRIDVDPTRPTRITSACVIAHSSQLAHA